MRSSPPDWTVVPDRLWLLHGAGPVHDFTHIEAPAGADGSCLLRSQTEQPWLLADLLWAGVHGASAGRPAREACYVPRPRAGAGYAPCLPSSAPLWGSTSSFISSFISSSMTTFPEGHSRGHPHGRGSPGRGAVGLWWRMPYAHPSQASPGQAGL